MASKQPTVVRVLVVATDSVLRRAIANTLQSSSFQIDASPLYPDGAELESALAGHDAAVIDCPPGAAYALEYAALLSSRGLSVIALCAVNGPRDGDAESVEGTVTILPRERWSERLRPALLAVMANGGANTAMRATNDQLLRALAQRRDVNVVVGILMERFHVDRAAAFESLRAEARNRRIRLDALAASVISAEERLHSVEWPAARRVLPAN